MQNHIGIIIGLSSIAGAIVCFRVTNWWTSRKRERKMRHGVKREIRGERLLKRYGYELDASQRSVDAYLWLDGKKVKYQLRPDAFVSKGGRSYVVEIKTGEVAGNAMFSDTRRQMLEYHYYAGADGVIFVNADEGRIERVAFPRRRGSSRLFYSLLVALAFGAGLFFGRAW